MTGITVVEVAGAQVEDTHKHRHEVTCGVLITQVVVHSIDNGGCAVSPSCLAAEHGSHDGHHQCCRHTLATDVAYAEQETVVAEEEVVEVAAHLESRVNEGIEAEIAALRKSLWQQRHLYAVGNFEFLLYRGFLGCGLLQFVHIVGKRMLHVCKRIVEHPHLVVFLNLRQLRLEVSLSHLSRRACKTVQWFGGATYHAPTDKIDEEKA